MLVWRYLSFLLYIWIGKHTFFQVTRSGLSCDLTPWPKIVSLLHLSPIRGTVTIAKSQILCTFQYFIPKRSLALASPVPDARKWGWGAHIRFPGRTHRWQAAWPLKAVYSSQMFAKPGSPIHPKPPSDPCRPSGGLTVLSVQYAFVKCKPCIWLSIRLFFLFFVLVDYYITSALLGLPLGNPPAPKALASNIDIIKYLQWRQKIKFLSLCKAVSLEFPHQTSLSLFHHNCMSMKFKLITNCRS